MEQKRYDKALEDLRRELLYLENSMKLMLPFTSEEDKINFKRKEKEATRLNSRITYFKKKQKSELNQATNFSSK